MSRGASGSARHLYVHLPFCAHRCGYCDFVTVVGRPEQHAAYVDALLGEFVIADFRQAHAEAGDFESGVSERCFFQDAAPRVVSLEKGRREVCASTFNASTGPPASAIFLEERGRGPGGRAAVEGVISQKCHIP